LVILFTLLKKWLVCNSNSLYEIALIKQMEGAQKRWTSLNQKVDHLGYLRLSDGLLCHQLHQVVCQRWWAATLQQLVNLHPFKPECCLLLQQQELFGGSISLFDVPWKLYLHMNSI